ncbi:MAG: ATP-dependent Clp protease ATP-binding subunit [Oscillospiraceae bacterium]|nr:ATP-dependent Clp protease ATP-binding subunit [Oscillospiraceae bacterium]
MFKFSGFTPKANSSINAAMGEASLLGHSFVGTEHLLWGILREGGGSEIKSIAESRIDCEKVMGKLLENIGRGTKANLSPADFFPLCRKVLENSLAEAKRNFSLADVGTIISAILRELECSAVKYLSALGCDLNELFREVSTMHLSADYLPKDKQKLKTPGLDKYSRDLTSLAKENAFDPVNIGGHMYLFDYSLYGGTISIDTHEEFIPTLKGEIDIEGTYDDDSITFGNVVYHKKTVTRNPYE